MRKQPVQEQTYLCKHSCCDIQEDGAVAHVWHTDNCLLAAAAVGYVSPWKATARLRALTEQQSIQAVGSQEVQVTKLGKRSTQILDRHGRLFHSLSFLVEQEEVAHDHACGYQLQSPLKVTNMCIHLPKNDPKIIFTSWFQNR